MYNQITNNKNKSIILTILFVGGVFGLAYLIGYINGADYYGTFTIALVISLVMTMTSYFAGDKIALMTARAQGPINQTDNPYIYRLVENLCITAGLPVPKIYIIPEAGLNAFACGRDPKHSSIALTQGIIEKLENEELEGVIAHELSHIKNYDIRLGTLIIVLVGTISILSNMFWRSNLLGHGRRDNREGSAGGILAIIGILLIVFSPVIAQLIRLAISRKREFLADASGALLTRYPEGLARALEKISQNPTLPMASEATAHLYIANPFSGKKLSKLFSTHPPVEERIKALRSMA